MVQSLELNRAYYHDCIAKILTDHCPEIAQRYAAALIGWGSEVLGNDDEFSKIYGWGPRVALFLTPEDLAHWGHKVVDILHKHVPPEILGQPTRFTDPTTGPPTPTTEPGGVLQIPITTCARFARLYLGLEEAEVAQSTLPSRRWLLIPEAGLLRLTAGEVFHDSAGTLTQLRDTFHYFPDDVWRYRLAYQWTRLSWDIDLIGLCAHRGDTLSARVTLARSVERIVGLIFLLNRVYKPGYPKWLHRQFYKLPHLAADLGPDLETLLASDDVMSSTARLYPILDALIAFQCRCADLPAPDYKKSAHLDRGFFAYDLQPIIDTLRATIHGELLNLPFKIGAMDQWVGDQDLLMWPVHLRSLAGIYDCEDPVAAIFRRNDFEHFL